MLLILMFIDIFQCDKFVNEYGPMIIKALIDAVSTDAVCHMIGICTLEKMTVSCK